VLNRQVLPVRPTFLKLCSTNGCLVFREAKMRNGRRVLLAVLNLHVRSKSFIYRQMHFISVLENIKIYIKTYINTAATCFGLRPSSGSLHMSLAKVTFIQSVKVRRYELCGCVAACYMFRSQTETCSMLPHNRIVHNDVISTNLLLIFVCVPHQLKINIM